jgi:Ribonuclease III
LKGDFALGPGASKDDNLTRVLTSKVLAQFGDALLNFAYSLALTETTGKPTGTRVSDRILAEAAVRAGLRKSLPRRVGRGEVANGLEALVGYSWLRNHLTLDEILTCLKAESLTHADNFAKLAELALSRLKT